MFLKKNAIKHAVFVLFDRIGGIGGRDTLYNIIREDWEDWWGIMGPIRLIRQLGELGGLGGLMGG